MLCFINFPFVCFSPFYTLMSYIPLRIIYSSDVANRKEIRDQLSKVKNVKICDNYFLENFLELLAVDCKKAKEYAISHCPFFQDGFYIEIEIETGKITKYTSANSSNTTKPGHKDKNSTKFDKDGFLDKIHKIIQEEIKALEKNVQSSTGFALLNTVFMTSYKLKQLADGYFYTKHYNSAEKHYRKITNSYPEYALRMIAMCEFMIKNNSVSDKGRVDFTSGASNRRKPKNTSINGDNPLVLDIYIANGDIKSVYNCRKWISNGEMAYVVDQWLDGQNLSIKKSLLVKYSCFRWNVTKKNTNKVEKYLQEIKELIEKERNDKIHESKMWDTILKRLEYEHEELDAK